MEGAGRDEEGGWYERKKKKGPPPAKPSPCVVIAFMLVWSYLINTAHNSNANDPGGGERKDSFEI
jgi:hypothetical protein